MKSSLLMDFSVDKENKKIAVKREFAAGLERVWNAWTESELLDQWWAPKPWKAITKHMDFTEGGYWLYAMTGPEGEEHWSRADYQKIVPRSQFVGLDCFCDANGNANPDAPRGKWDVKFNEQDHSTFVDITLSFDKLEDLEMIIQMGFEGGFKMGLSNLDELLEN